MSEAAFSVAFASQNFTFKDEETLRMLLHLAEELHMKPDAAATNYDVYVSMRDLPFEIAIGHVSGFKDFMAKEATKGKENTAKSKPVVVGRSPITARSWEDVPDKVDYPTPKRQATEASMRAGFKAAGAGNAGQTTPPLHTTPAMGTKTIPALSPPNTATKFTARTNKGQVVSTLHPEAVLATTPLSEVQAKRQKQQQQQAGVKRHSACVLELLGEPLSCAGGAHLHMMDTVDIKVNTIEERIQDFADAFKASMPDEAADVDKAPVAGVTQDLVWVVGRVVSDSEGVLNDASVLLEGSRAASDGARVRLDLSSVDLQFRLFPGQVVAVQGLNPTGKRFIAHQICANLPATAPTQPQLSSVDSDDVAPLTVVVAAGPFTTIDDMLFEPLTELLQFCSDKQPDLVLLMGPFVDSDHPLIRDGVLDISFDALFQEQVLAQVTAWQQHNQGCRVAVMPAVKDAHAAPVFPQPAMSLGSAAAGGEVGADGVPVSTLTSLQNPCTFAVSAKRQQQRVCVSACSVDIIKHLAAAEIYRTASGHPAPDRMAALASHVVGQRNFYPMCPPQLGACLDSSQASQLVLCQTPNILLLPSDLAPFAKVLPQSRPQIGTSSSTAATAAADSKQELVSTVCINPGRLVKGTSGGTFAHVVVAGGEGMGVKADSIRVEIRKI